MVLNKFKIYFVIIIFFTLGVLSFRKYTQSEYLATINSTSLIQDFKNVSTNNLAQIKSKHNIDYIHINNDRIISYSNSFFNESIEIIPIIRKRSPNVMAFSTEQYLRSIEPLVVLRSSSLYLIFPLVFEGSEDSFILIKKII